MSVPGSCGSVVPYRPTDGLRLFPGINVSHMMGARGRNKVKVIHLQGKIFEVKKYKSLHPWCVMQAPMVIGYKVTMRQKLNS